VKRLLVFFALMMVICVSAYSSDIALYVGEPDVEGWYSIAVMLADVETIKNEVGGKFQDIKEFGDDKLAELAAWTVANTDDGELDILWLNGCMPSTLYPFPNLEPDGSVIENWLDGGNMIINVGDWFAYVSYEGGGRKVANDADGAANILNLPAGIIYKSENATMTVTETGKKYLPSLGDSCMTDRPVAFDQAIDPWEVAAAFATVDGEEDSTGGEPVVIHNTETGAYVAIVNQSAGGGPPHWLDDRGLTCAELIKNWVAEVVGLSPVEPADKLPDTWGNIKSK